MAEPTLINWSRFIPGLGDAFIRLPANGSTATLFGDEYTITSPTASLFTFLVPITTPSSATKQAWDIVIRYTEGPKAGVVEAFTYTNYYLPGGTANASQGGRVSVAIVAGTHKLVIDKLDVYWYNCGAVIPEPVFELPEDCECIPKDEGRILARTSTYEQIDALAFEGYYNNFAKNQSLTTTGVKPVALSTLVSNTLQVYKTIDETWTYNIPATFDDVIKIQAGDSTPDGLNAFEQKAYSVEYSKTTRQAQGQFLPQIGLFAMGRYFVLASDIDKLRPQITRDRTGGSAVSNTSNISQIPESSKAPAPAFTLGPNFSNNVVITSPPPQTIAPSVFSTSKESLETVEVQAITYQLQGDLITWIAREEKKVVMALLEPKNLEAQIANASVDIRDVYKSSLELKADKFADLPRVGAPDFARFPPLATYKPVPYRIEYFIRNAPAGAEPIVQSMELDYFVASKAKAFEIARASALIEQSKASAYDYSFNLARLQPEQWSRLKPFESLGISHSKKLNSSAYNMQGLSIGLTSNGLAIAGTGWEMAKATGFANTGTLRCKVFVNTITNEQFARAQQTQLPADFTLVGAQYRDNASGQLYNYIVDGDWHIVSLFVKTIGTGDALLPPAVPLPIELEMSPVAWRADELGLDAVFSSIAESVQWAWGPADFTNNEQLFIGADIAWSGIQSFCLKQWLPDIRNGDLSTDYINLTSC